MDRYRAFLRNVSRWPWRATLRTLATRFKEDRLGVTAGSLTFTTIIALVPLLTVMLALFTAFPVFGRFRTALQAQLVSSLMPEFIARKVLVLLTTFSSKASQLGSMSLLALGLTAMMLMLTIDHTLNAIWRVKVRRSIAKRVLIYWAAVTLGPLLLGVSLSTSSYVISASRGWVDALPGGVDILLSLVVFGLKLLSFAALFRFVPFTHVRWEHALAGAVYVSLAMVLVDKGLALYLSGSGTYTTVYGAFAALPIFLTWIYVSWLIVLQGAVVAAYAPSLLTRATAWPDVPGGRFKLALAVMTTLDAARQHGRPGLTAQRLSRKLRVDPLQLEAVLGDLIALDWLARLDEPGDRDGGRFVLLCDLQRTPVAALAELTLLSNDHWVRAFWRRADLSGMSVAQALGREGDAAPTV